MPRDFVILSAEPITAIEVVVATAGVDPDLGLARLWEGGGMQVATGESELVLAVLRSSAVESRHDAERLLGVPLADDAAWWTEAYGPFYNEVTDAVAERLARDVSGTLIERGKSI